MTRWSIPDADGVRRGRAHSGGAARRAPRAGAELGRENPGHQGGGRRAGACPPARRHPPGHPPQHDVEAVLAGKGPAIDTELLAAELNRHGRPNIMSDPAGATEIIGRMCAPQRSDRYATVAEAMEDLAICEP